MTPAGRPWQGAQPVHGSADTSYRRIGVVYGRWGALIRPGIRPRSGLKRSPAASPGFPLPLGPLGEGLKFGNFDDFSQCCSSRGAALECSPGRKPGVSVSTGGQPRRGERFRADSFAPSGAGFATGRTPGSRPGLRSYAAPRQKTQDSRFDASKPPQRNVCYWDCRRGSRAVPIAAGALQFSAATCIKFSRA